MSKFIAKKNNIVYYTSNETGLKPILSKINEDPFYFKNADIEDIIIGKAAASLLILSKVHSIYAHTISQNGKMYLMKHNINFTYDKEVKEIHNREKSDMCPLEKVVLDIEDPKQAKVALELKIKELMKKT